ncbi:MAG: tyrosine-type recombinase/integrase, partial [Anaerolineae bacterium]
MEITLPNLVDLFASTKQTEGRSPSTIEWYKYRLAQFLSFEGQGTRLIDLNIANVRAFIASLQARTTRFENHPLAPVQEGGLSPFTIHGYVRAIKAFSSWIYEEGFSKTNLLAKLKRPTLPKPVIEILNDAEIERLVNSSNPNTFLGARMMVMTLLLMDTGMRASELLGLTLDNVDFTENKLKVLGKGNKERIIGFDVQTKKYLLRYISTFRPTPANERIKEVVLAVDGTPLTYCALAHMVRRLGMKEGVPRLHAHL